MSPHPRRLAPRLTLALLGTFAIGACTAGQPTYGDGIASAAHAFESACTRPLAQLAAEADLLAREIGDPNLSPDAAFPYARQRIIDLATSARSKASGCSDELDRQRGRASLHNRPPEPGLEPDWP